MMDRSTLEGLQIFQEDTHPSIVGIGRSKEGFSVFGTMDRCVTTAVRFHSLNSLQSVHRENVCCIHGS